MTVPPRIDDQPDWDALARHRAGECVGDEARRISAWLAAHPQDAEMLAALDDALITHFGAAAPAGDEPDVEAALRAVHARMRDASSAGVIPFPRAHVAAAARYSFSRWVAAGVAAAAAIVALAVGLGRTRDGADHRRALAGGGVLTTAVGVRDSVLLPDGTRVVLGPASRLAVAPDYGRGERRVTLEGTAWFAVRHQQATPFIVRAGPATVMDLGTAFTVRADDENGVRGVTVAVTEGKVQLHSDQEPASAVTLNAGDRGVVLANGRVLSRPDAGDADVAWMQGRLVYRDTPLTTVRADLRHWYGVELQVADSSLLARRITATFEGEPVDRVLQVIALALGGDVERRDSVAILRGGATR